MTKCNGIILVFPFNINTKTVDDSGGQIKIVQIKSQCNCIAALVPTPCELESALPLTLSASKHVKLDN